MPDTYLYEGFATGALRRPDDARDWQLERLPEVRARLAVGLPNSYRIIPMETVPASVKLNQGPIPKCVAASICIAKSAEEFKDIGRWQVYNDQELYQACGGNGSTGIYTETALKYTQEKGVILADGSRRYTISSYMFAPKVYRQWRETLCAAMMELGPVVIASLLPSNFGWESGDSLQGPQSYHQYCGWGWDGLGDDDWVVALNSWGPGYANQGFVRVKWKVLETGGTFQGGYTYAYKMADFIDSGTIPDPQPDPQPEPEPEPEPEPQPTPKVTVTAEALGGGLEFLREGLVLSASGGGYSGTLVLSDVDREPGPDPQPEPEPEPEPEPGEFNVQVIAWMPPRSTSRVSIVAYAKTTGGAWVSGIGRAALNGRDLGEHSGNGIYQWQPVGNAGDVAVVTITDQNGASVKAEATVKPPGAEKVLIL